MRRPLLLCHASRIGRTPGVDHAVFGAAGNVLLSLIILHCFPVPSLAVAARSRVKLNDIQLE